MSRYYQLTLIKVFNSLKTKMFEKSICTEDWEEIIQNRKLNTLFIF